MLTLTEKGIRLNYIDKALLDQIISIATLELDDIDPEGGLKASDLLIALRMPKMTYKQLKEMLDRLDYLGIIRYSLTGKKYVLEMTRESKYHKFEAK